MWENIDKSSPDSAHYSIMRLHRGEGGMGALREMFPDAKADELNLVLFSTSGVHGTYNTIEEAEKAINGEDPETYFSEVTFVIVHPRLVTLRYGVCSPETQDDIEFLKRLRESSHEAVAGIGIYETPNGEVSGGGTPSA